MTTARINREQMPFAKPPFSYEYIGARERGQYRLRDTDDNAIGSADNEVDAREAVSRLNSQET